MRGKFATFVANFFYIPMSSINDEILMALLQDVAAIKAKVAPDVQPVNFYAEAVEHIDSLASQGREKSAECYRRSLNALTAFLGTSYIPLDSLTYPLLLKLLEDLRQRVSENTAKGYLSEIRVLYNVVAGRHDINTNPFRKLNLARHSGRGLRALTSRQIRKIAQLENLPPAEAMARDLFLLSFCLCGVNMCDLFTMAPPVDGRIEYDRQKTRRRRKDNAHVSLALHPFAKILADRWAAPEGSAHWLQFFSRYASEEYFLRTVNDGLHAVGRRAGLPCVLTSYFARHSWASIARNECDIDIYDISQCLAHTPPAAKVDFIYIKEDFFRIDRANTQVISRVFRPQDALVIAS